MNLSYFKIRRIAQPVLLPLVLAEISAITLVLSFRSAHAQRMATERRCVAHSSPVRTLPFLEGCMGRWHFVSWFPYVGLGAGAHFSIMVAKMAMGYLTNRTVVMGKCDDHLFLCAPLLLFLPWRHAIRGLQLQLQVVLRGL